MSMGSLKKLKELRKRRVERAYIELQSSKEYLLYCEKELAKKYHEQREYSAWRLRHQDNLFGELQSDYFSPEDLGSYLADLENMKFRKKQLEDALQNTKKKYEVAQKNAHEKQMALSLITKKLEKLSEIIDIQMKDLSSGAGRAEEDAVDELVAFRASS